MLLINGGEGLVELAAQRLGHDRGVAHRHAQALVAEHAADRLDLKTCVRQEDLVTISPGLPAIPQSLDILLA
jgi:hypothetical protein